MWVSEWGYPGQNKWMFGFYSSSAPWRWVDVSPLLGSSSDGRSHLYHVQSTCCESDPCPCFKILVQVQVTCKGTPRCLYIIILQEEILGFHGYFWGTLPMSMSHPMSIPPDAARSSRGLALAPRRGQSLSASTRFRRHEPKRNTSTRKHPVPQKKRPRTTCPNRICSVYTIASMALCFAKCLVPEFHGELQ